jgi:hypothetical protein
MVQARGYQVVPSGSGHWKILDSKGRSVRDNDGPLILSGTSSEVRSRAMSVKRLLDAGVLDIDPWAPQKPKGERNGDEPDERTAQEEAEREAAAERQRSDDFRRSERTRLVRERMEPMVVLLGGWDKRGLRRELGTVAFYVAERLGLEPRWSSAEAAAENADGIRKGATLSTSMAACWERFLNEIEAWPDMQGRYMMLLREAKGLAEPSIGSDQAHQQREIMEEVAGGPVRQQPLPVSSLALELAYELGVGRTDSLDKPRAMQLLTEVLQLEQRAHRLDAETSHEDEGDDREEVPGGSHEDGADRT